MDSPYSTRPTVANCLVKKPFSNMSKKEMADWFIPHTGSRQTLEELSTGVIYSRLLSQLFPDCLNPKKLRTGSKLTDDDKLHNWKVFQLGLRTLKLDKEVNAVLMIKPTSVEGFQFCKWFLAFYCYHQYGPVMLPVDSFFVPTTPRSRSTTGTPRFRTPGNLQTPRGPLRDTPRPRTLLGDQKDKIQRAGSPIRIIWEDEKSVVFKVPEMTPNFRHVTLSRETSLPVLSEAALPQLVTPCLSPILAKEKKPHEQEELPILENEEVQDEEDLETAMGTLDQTRPDSHEVNDDGTDALIEEYGSNDVQETLEKEENPAKKTAQEPHDPVEEVPMDEENLDINPAEKRSEIPKTQEKKRTPPIPELVLGCFVKQAIGWLVLDFYTTIVSK